MAINVNVSVTRECCMTACHSSRSLTSASVCIVVRLQAFVPKLLKLNVEPNKLSC